MKESCMNIQSLGNRGYCPTISVVKQWSDRKNDYPTAIIFLCFVKLDEKDRSLVFQVPGVVRYLLVRKTCNCKRAGDTGDERITRRKKQKSLCNGDG